MTTRQQKRKPPGTKAERGNVKVYTRHGDRGLTDVPAIGRAGKDNPRVAACGALDELNCMIGELRARIDGSSIASATRRGFLRKLMRIQREILSVGSLVSGAVQPKRGPAVRHRAAIQRFETEIDRMQEDLPPLRGFILPGGDPLSASAHLARSFCRRAERAAVAALGNDPAGQIVIPYLNRLSDWIFVMARRLAHESGRADEPWRKRPNPKPRGKTK